MAWGDARIVSSHLLIGGVNQARAANVVLRLIRAGSCGEAGARTTDHVHRFDGVK